MSNETENSEMARSRNIKPGFFENETLGQLPSLTRLLFIGLWLIADREGRLEDRPLRIKAKILPYDACNVEKLLAQLAETGFIVRYTVEGEQFIAIPKFHKHQNPHLKEAASTLPAPDLHQISTGLAPEIPERTGLIPSSLIPDSLNLIPDSSNTGKTPTPNPSEVDLLKPENQNQKQPQNQDLPPDSAAPPSVADTPPCGGESSRPAEASDIQTLVSRLRHDAKWNVNSRDRAELEFYISEEGPDLGELLAHVSTFAEKPYWRKYNRKPAAFIKSFREVPRGAYKVARHVAAATPVQRAEPEPRETSSPVTADAPALPSCVLRWNVAVPEPQREKYWNGNSPKEELACAMADPEFIENFDSICVTCCTVIAAGRYKIPGFTWLLDRAAGKRINWWRILHGQFAWAESAEGAKPQSREKTAVEVAEENLAKVLREKEKLNGAAKSNTETACPTPTAG